MRSWSVPLFLLAALAPSSVEVRAASTEKSTAAPISARMLLLDGAVVGNDVIAVGELGTILHSTDSGQTWRRSQSNTRATLTGVSFAPPHGWAVGHDAQILASTDAGRTWMKQYQGENLQDSFLDVLALDAQRIIAVGAYGLFVHTSNGGKTWERRKVIDDDYHFNRITRGPAGTLYLAGEHGTLLRSLDAGQTWTKLAAPYDGSFYGLLPLEPRTLLIHGLRGRVFLSPDDGVTWRALATPQPALVATAVRTKSNVLVFGGQARAMFISRDGGKSLETMPDALPTAVAELIELPDGRLLALGEAGATVLSAPR